MWVYVGVFGCVWICVGVILGMYVGARDACGYVRLCSTTSTDYTAIVVKNPRCQNQTARKSRLPNSQHQTGARRDLQGGFASLSKT